MASNLGTTAMPATALAVFVEGIKSSGADTRQQLAAEPRPRVHMSISMLTHECTQ